MIPTNFSRARLRTVIATALCAASLTAFSPAVTSATPDTAATTATGLVGDVTRTESEIDRLALEIGGLHEEVNKSLVDLHDAQATAEQARQAVLTARAELDGTQAKIDQAQVRLDEISRAAYRRTAAPPAVITLAGEDASNDSLDRQTYLRTNSDKQRAALEELDQLRTEQANRESQLRLARDLAEQREARAAIRETDVRGAIERNNAQITVLAAERDRLAAERDAAREQLNAARNEIAAGNAAQQDAEEYRAAEAARKDAEDLAAADAEAAAGARRIAEEETAAADAARVEAADTAEAAVQAALEVEQQQEEEAAAEKAAVAAAEAAEVAEAAVQAALEVEQQQEEKAAAEKAAVAAAEAEEQAALEVEQRREDRERREAEAQAAAETARQAEDEARARAEAQELAEREAAELTRQETEAQAFRDAATAAAVAAAAAVVAQSQPEHTSLDNPYPSVTDEETAPADIAAVQSPATLAEDVADASASAEVITVPVIDTIEDVTEQAAGEVAAIGDRSAQIEAVIARAETQLGLPYAWGGGNASGPTRGIRDGGVADSYGDFNKIGFDCSGLTLYAFAGAGIALPHYTGYQYNHGTKVDPGQMERGDLIFYGPGGSHHVAIYLGDGMMLEAPNSGSVVKKSPVRWSGMSPHAVRLV
ncbi:DIP1281 family NlpC/P60 protein [Corynebacterium comes]|uniref:Peptidoglycan endopeptidase RipA n=1 Tax=Corynebacterium comes TaxID=2675218 RepID=A0A6B8W456_9CORY|nr:NlpC/P60 family protein [Corynebacterium comes]QGU04630.1 Peptidoglycan endopeptidase RipA precursor [Corynebacterium comes]